MGITSHVPLLHPSSAHQPEEKKREKDKKTEKNDKDKHKKEKEKEKEKHKKDKSKDKDEKKEKDSSNKRGLSPATSIKSDSSFKRKKHENSEVSVKLPEKNTLDDSFNKEKKKE